MWPSLWERKSTITVGGGAWQSHLLWAFSDSSPARKEDDLFTTQLSSKSRLLTEPSIMQMGPYFVPWCLAIVKQLFPVSSLSCWTAPFLVPGWKRTGFCWGSSPPHNSPWYFQVVGFSSIKPRIYWAKRELTVMSFSDPMIPSHVCHLLFILEFPHGLIKPNLFYFILFLYGACQSYS